MKITNENEFQIIFNDPSFSFLSIFRRDRNVDTGNILATIFFQFVKTERLWLVSQFIGHLIKS